MHGEVQLVLQNSQGALDPRRRIYESIAEPLRKLRHLTRQEEQHTVHDILHKVQLQDDILMRFQVNLVVASKAGFALRELWRLLRGW